MRVVRHCTKLSREIVVALSLKMLKAKAGCGFDRLL